MVGWGGGVKKKKDGGTEGGGGRRGRGPFEDGGTTYFVDHHDGEEVTDGGEEQAVEVMLDLVADAGGKDVENDLSGHEEEDAKGNVAQWPAILQRIDDEEDLHD